MIVTPRIRGFICLTAHPQGCAAHVAEQIAHVRRQLPIAGGPKKVLIIGASGGYGLASRITAAFGSGAATLGVFFERAPEKGKTASAGWYNAIAFDTAARAEGLYSKSLNGDAFSDAMKAQVVETIRRDLGQVDCVVYSLASPRRTDPVTGEVYKSVLKTTGTVYVQKNLDTDRNLVVPATVDPATEEEIRATVKTMGGEDWERWADALLAGGVLAPGATYLTYSYIGPEVTRPFYREGTIGRAKDHLEATAHRLHERMQAHGGGRALVSVNKAVVTQASSAIPVVPLYLSLLLKVMKEKGLHEGCIEQIHRLFADRLYGGIYQTDLDRRVRLDDWEMRTDVQHAVAQLWPTVTTENLYETTDYKSYQAEFLRLFGFGLPGVDYTADVEVELPLLP